MFNFFRRKTQKRVPLEEQLRVLHECGISLCPGVRADSLLLSFDREALEMEPYLLVLCVMGGEAEDPSLDGGNGYPSDHIWHFDTECIEDHGDYARIATRMATLARGELPLAEIRDQVDVEAGSASLTFSLMGNTDRWQAKVDGDWVDPEILTRFARLLEAQGTSRRFTYIDLGGQDCLIGCATQAEKDRLASATGLAVDWLR